MAKAATKRKGGTKPKLTARSKSRVIKALDAAGGIITQASVLLGVERTTLHRYLNLYPDVRDKRRQIQDKRIDIAETKVVEAIDAGDMRTVRWYLDRFGRDRGYVTRSEITGKDGGPVEIEPPTMDVAKLTLKEKKELLALKAKASVKAPGKAKAKNADAG